MSFLLIFGILSLSLIVHEFGHFIVAKLSGVVVEEFSLFVGPKIFSRDIKGTTFSLRTIPIAAYVMFNPESYASTSLPKRIAILLGGVTANFILALSAWFVSILIVTQSFDASWHGSWYFISDFFGRFWSSVSFDSLSSPVGIVKDGGSILKERTMSINKSTFDFLPIYILSSLNLSLFIVNLLPLSQLDGGQVLFSLLHPVFGNYKSYKRFKVFFDFFSLAVLLSLMIFGLKNDLFRMIGS
jgi:regulator of sigma E protease